MSNEKVNEPKSKTNQKCFPCFRIEECMLKTCHGAKYCLGPFKDEDDRTEKIRADNRKEEEAIEKEREAGLRKLRKKDLIEEYRINRMFSGLLFSGDKPNDNKE